MRYERERPGELVHMDVKKLGRIPDGGGWRAHGRAASPAPERQDPRSATTTSTRWSMTTPAWPTPRSCPTRRAPTCAAFLARASTYFAAHGITRIERLMTDNAWAYRYSLRERLRRARHQADVHQAALPLAERQGRTPQPHPGHRVGLPAASSPPTTNAAAALAPWLEHYNTQRRHSALGGHPPDQPTATNLMAGYT